MAKLKRYALLLMTMLATGLIILFALFSNQVKPASASLGYDHVVDVWQRVWNEILQYTPSGQYYEVLVLRHSEEVQALTSNDPVHIMRLWQVAEKFVPGMQAMLDGKGDTVQITKEQISALKAELEWLASVGSESLRVDIQSELQRLPLEKIVGMTMNEALNYINANVSAPPTVEPTPIAVGTSTPTPVSIGQCVAGYDPDCLAEPTLVPESDGQWAYYVLNGVYFEYPSRWRVELWADRTEILSLIPTDDSPEGAMMDDIPVFAGVFPDAIIDVEYNPLTYPQTAWLRPAPFWNRLVSLPDLTGSEFLWADTWDTSYIYVEAILYDPNTQIAMGLLMAFKNDPPNELVHEPDFVREQFPNFWRIMSSLRIGSPHQP